MIEHLEEKLQKLEKEQNLDGQRLQMVNNQKNQLENNIKVRVGKIQVLQELLQELDNEKEEEEVVTVEADA